MADGSIIIDARINKKGAEAELQALQAKAKSTAQQIAAVDKQLGGETKRRNTLRDDLEAARQKASETAAALEEVNARLDAGRKSKFGVTNAADEALSNKLAAQLNAQDAKVRETEAGYRAQDAAVQALQQRHIDLTAQLEREQQAAQAQDISMEKTIPLFQKGTEYLVTQQATCIICHRVRPDLIDASDQIVHGSIFIKDHVSPAIDPDWFSLMVHPPVDHIVVRLFAGKNLCKFLLKRFPVVRADKLLMRFHNLVKY